MARDQRHTPRSAVGNIALIVGAILLLLLLSGASVALIAPDVLRDLCDRPQLMAPEGCGSASAGG